MYYGWTLIFLNHLSKLMDVQTCFYSGLENCCNVWKFWIDCNAALDSIKIMLSTGGVE